MNTGVITQKAKLATQNQQRRNTTRVEHVYDDKKHPQSCLTPPPPQREAQSVNMVHMHTHAHPPGRIIVEVGRPQVAHLLSCSTCRAAITTIKLLATC